MFLRLYPSVFLLNISPQKESRGFVLLFAVLVSNILLAIGLGIFTIAYKELILSSSDRESQVAFYAADSGSECAVYWDVVHPDFSESIFGYVDSDEIVAPISGSGSPVCAGVDINDAWTTTENGVTPIETKFSFTMENGSCATVTVIKGYDDVANRAYTRIDSRGFNTCSESTGRRSERGLRLSY
jgi:hypothetical protein